MGGHCQGFPVHSSDIPDTNCKRLSYNLRTESIPWARIMSNSLTNSPKPRPHSLACRSSSSLVSSLTRTSTFADNFPRGDELPLLARCVVIMRSLFVIGSIGMLMACGKTSAEICEEKNAKLDSLMREAQANILRQRGECQAIAHELQDQKMTESCVDTLRFVVDAAQSTREIVAKRREENDMVKCGEMAH